MVKLHIKRENDSYFLFETRADAVIADFIEELLTIYNGIIYICNLSAGLEDLARYGVGKKLEVPVEEQLSTLNVLKDCPDNFTPFGGYVECTDPQGRRCGLAPIDKMAEVICKTTAEACARVSKNQVLSEVCLTEIMVKEACQMLAGSVAIVYPKGLPPYDPLYQDIQRIRDHPESCLSQLCSSSSGECLEKCQMELWWAGKCLQQEKKLSDYVGTNEKTKIIVKIQKRGEGPAGREPLLTEEEQKRVMLQQYRRQEELKKLSECDDTSCMDSEWMDNLHLKKSFQGLKDIKWRPK